MASTRSTLEEVGSNLDESMGVRRSEPRAQLSPVPSAKDIGRRPLRNVGRVQIELVVPDPDQPRKEFSQDSIERLARSLRDKKQLSPIRVRWSAEFSRWIIISGERRWRAAQQAGLSTIDCTFDEEHLTTNEIREQQLIENLLREDLKPIEEARAFAELMEANDWNGKQVAEALQVPPSRVCRALALLDLPPEVQQKVEAGTIATRSAYELSKLSDERIQRELAAKAEAGRLTHAQAAETVRQCKGKRATKSRGTKLVFFTEDGWKTTVTKSGKANYHEVAEALRQALEEVEHRIANNIQLF